MGHRKLSRYAPRRFSSIRALQALTMHLIARLDPSSGTTAAISTGSLPLSPASVTHQADGLDGAALYCGQRGGIDVDHYCMRIYSAPLRWQFQHSISRCFMHKVRCFLASTKASARRFCDGPISHQVESKDQCTGRKLWYEQGALWDQPAAMVQPLSSMFILPCRGLQEAHLPSSQGRLC